MADLKTVDSSSKLKAFKEFYEEKISSLSSKQQSLSEELNTYAKSVESIKIDFKSSADDANSQLIDEGLQLAKEGIDQLNKGANLYLESFFKDCKDIYDAYIKKIEETGNNLLNSDSYKNASDEDKDKKIDETNTSIDKLIAAGEGAIDKLISAYSNAKFGIVGNMHIGGVLGKLVGADGAVLGGGELPEEPGKEPPGETDINEKTSLADVKAGDKYVGKAWNGEPIHYGSSEVYYPTTMYEFKEAMRKGGVIVLDKVKYHYDPGGELKGEMYDATSQKVYLVKCSDGNYRAVDESGSLVYEWSRYIKPERAYEASDTSTCTYKTIFDPWVNHTGFQYSGEAKQPEQKQPEQKQQEQSTGVEHDTLTDVQAGDVYTGKAWNGDPIHYGSSNEIYCPSSMAELKEAMRNGGVIVLDKVKYHYDPGGELRGEMYDATSQRIYLVQCSDGNYRAVDEKGNLVNKWSQYIKPERAYEASDTSTCTYKTIFDPWVNHTGFVSSEK